MHNATALGPWAALLLDLEGSGLQQKSPLGVPPLSALLDRNAEGAQKVYILGVKSLVSLRIFSRWGFQLGGRLLFYLIQSNRRFQHEQHVETLLADILHHFGDLLGLGNRLMNGLSQLLDETTKSLIQRGTPNRHLRTRFNLPYL